MSRESRLIAILLVIAAIGIAGLMVVANQYRKALAGADAVDREDAPARAARLVDGFLAAREAAQSVVARYRGKPDDLTSVYRIERFNAFSAHGMTYEDYVAVRAAWRTYRTTGHAADPALVVEFRARSAALNDASPDAIEALDEGIK